MDIFSDASRPDPFYDATSAILGALAQGPAAGDRGRPPFALDVQERIADLTAAGFENVEVETIRWSACLDTLELRALYATFSPIARLNRQHRERVLDDIAAIAERSFAGRVARPFQTVLYTAQNP